MTTVTDVPRIQPITDTDTAQDDDAHRDQAAGARAELVRLLAQAYVDAPLFA